MHEPRVAIRLIEAETQLDHALMEIYRLHIKLAQYTNTEPPSYSLIVNSRVKGHSVDKYRMYLEYSDRLNSNQQRAGLNNKQS